MNPLAFPLATALPELPPGLWQALGLTLRLALATTVLLLAGGLPLAHWLNNTRLRGAAALEALVGLPIVLPPTVIGFYLLVLFAPGHGPGALWLRVTGEPLAFSFPGLLLGSVLYSLPYAVQPFQAALRAVPADTLAAARLEATPLQAFLRVHLPLAARGVGVGATLAFAHTVGEFGVVLMLGGNIPGRTRVASIALYDETQKLNFPAAHLYAGVLLVLSFALLLGIALLGRRGGRFAE